MSCRTNSTHSYKKTPFCKVCKDAGLSKEEYTSHYVKDQPGPHGRVVCPTLLSQKCRYCKNAGHTVKYCPVLKQREHTTEHDSSSCGYETDYTVYSQDVDICKTQTHTSSDTSSTPVPLGQSNETIFIALLKQQVTALELNKINLEQMQQDILYRLMMAERENFELQEELAVVNTHNAGLETEMTARDMNENHKCDIGAL